MTQSGPATPGLASGAAEVDGIDIDAVASAVRGCAAVDDLYSSASASVASYLPGRQVAGVRVDAGVLTIQVRSRWGVPFREVAQQIRTATAPLAGGHRVDVTIADLADAPGEDAPETESAIGPSALASSHDEPAERDEVVWTSTSGNAGAPSSATTIPTAAVTRPPS